MLFNRGLSQRVKIALAATFDSVVTVYRLTDEKVGSITKQTRPEIFANVPCRRSKFTTSAINPTTGAATVVYSEKLFIGPEWAIKTGDELMVTGPLGAANPGPDRYFAGNIVSYASHQEIRLEIRGRS